MEKLDFTFIKERETGEFIQDFFSLFKRIFKHFHLNILRFLLPFLAVFLVLIFFIITPGKHLFTEEITTNNSGSGVVGIFILGLLFLLIILLFYLLFIAPFGIEYLFLLRERGNFSFSYVDVRKNILKHLKKYFKFFLAALVAGFILLLPFGIVVIFLSLIPFLGQLAVAMLSACITTVFMCALFLYLQDKAEGAFSSFMNSFRLIKKKILSYGLSAFLFRILLTICIGFAIAIPSIILGVIAYTTTGFNKSIFLSFGGKLILSIGGSVLILLVVLGSIYMILFYGLIYFSSLETSHKEATLDQIDQIGLAGDE